MSKEAIVERILSDAEAEAQVMISEAEKKAAGIVADAEARVEAQKAETRRECAELARSIAEGKAATARLDSKKILLKEKRRVIDTVYDRALKKLLALGEKESLSLAEKLLKTYADEGDEVVFAENFAYAEQAAALSVFKEKKLVLSEERAKIDGGFLLRSKKSDRDVSYGSILSADREEHQAELASALFRVQ